MSGAKVVDLAVESLHPHPSNPRIEPRQEVVDQIAGQIADGFDPAHALIVRDVGGTFEIISGHHRWLAAKQAGLAMLPCWVRVLDDDEAYMQLVLCNTQSELHPLEEGKHAAESPLDLKAYAQRSGKAYDMLARKVRAYRVVSVCNVANATERSDWMAFCEIHAAPRWLWSALAQAMLASGWTVAQTRERVASFKGLAEPAALCDAVAMAVAIVDGIMKPTELERIASMLDNLGAQGIRDTDLQNDCKAELESRWIARLSDVQAVVNVYTARQEQRDREQREAELARQRAQETAEARVIAMRKNCSLDEWKSLSEDERGALLVPAPGAGGSFNAQTNEAIEWAQWSWNPVTGCKHDCPYCYARDIALGPRMQKSGLYPNGFEPTFRSNALNAPGNTKVPKQSAQDARYRNVFTCSMADLFGRWVPAAWIDAVMSTMRDSPEWNFLCLTKFPQRLKECDIPTNAWMGTTVDMQSRVANAEKAFAAVTCGVKWLSVEPLIEPLRFDRLDVFDWLVIGGASRSDRTPEWRPPYRWIEDLVRQADDAGVPVYMKTNLGIENRLIELPFDAPIEKPPQVAPDVFHYLGAKGKAPEAKND